MSWVRHAIRRLWPAATGLLLVPVLIAQSGSIELPLDAMSGRCGGIQPFSGRASASLSGIAERDETVQTERVVAEGRVAAYPGAEVVVGSEAAGRVVTLAVEEKSVVRRGQLLAELNGDDVRASLAEARAHIAEAEADLRHHRKELRREQTLLSRRAGTQEAVDQGVHNLEATEARLAAAVATRDRYEALLRKTRIVAPIDGVVTARHVHPGETIEVNARVVTLVDLNRLRIEAEVDEFDVERVRLTAPVRVTTEGSNAIREGRVEEIPDAVVGRRLRPEDPGRPIDARVLPVKIALKDTAGLKIGQRVEVEIAETPSSPHAMAR